jgi:hypothetical protein
MTEAQELQQAERAVANSKLTEFRHQCRRLAELVRAGTVRKQVAVDRLWTIAIAHALIRSLGHDRVERIIAEAFVTADPMNAEVAA